MRTPGLSPEQGPPLAIPLSFFLTAPLSVAAGGVLLLVYGSTVLISGFVPHTLLLTHLGTLGFLGMVMFGALYQMSPVVASAHVRPVRLAYGVHATMVIGLILLALAILGGIPMRTGLHSGYGFLELALLTFVITTGIAFGRTRARGDTVTGMRLALVSLAATVVIGITVELAYHGTFVLPDRSLGIRVHMVVALLGWVGGLIGAVAWQVLPMFYLAEPVPPRRRRLVLWMANIGVLATAAVLLVRAIVPALPAGWISLATAAPAVLAVWILHPLWLFQGLRRRRRARADVSLLFWNTGLAMAPVAAAAAVWAALSPDPRTKVLVVYVAVWGWAGILVHGMLSRIVPFLVWFHRYSRLIGRVPVPSVRSLLPEAWVRVTYFVHLGALATGILATVTSWDWAARVTGALLLTTAGIVLGWLLRVATRRPPPAAGQAETGAVPHGTA